MIPPRRGEIYYVAFRSVGAREISGPHPALVVQNDVANRVSHLTIVAAITTNPRIAELPVGVRVSPEESGLPRPSVIHLGQLRTVDHTRLERRIGRLSSLKMREVEQALRVSLGFSPFGSQGRGAHRPN